LGCDTAWGVPAVLGAQVCQEPLITDVQFKCADNTCTHIAGRCNGVNNCADGSDEQGCATTSTSITLEAMTGFTATVETPIVGSAVFYDRSYTFESLGSFTGKSFVKMSNEDKHISHSHVQMKLRLPTPQILFVAQLDGSELPWLEAEGWTLTNLDGVSYKGTRATRHTEWSEELLEDHYGPGRVWQKAFTAGAVEMRGNNGGMGSYVIFATHPSMAPVPVVTTACPSGWEQVGEDGADIGGCGLQGCEERYWSNNPSECADACAARSDCLGFNWAPLAGDRNHEATTVCTLYNSDTPTGSWHGSAGHVQIFCKPHQAYHYGEPSGNTCPTSDVSEQDCLGAVQLLLPKDQSQGRTSLVAGSWGWVPPGCSVQSHFTHGQNGDWAAHYNRNSAGQNDGGYTPVCVSSSPVYTTFAADTKCPHESGDRLFRNPSGGSSQITLDQCYAQCATTADCNAFSWGSFQGAYVCMGCTHLDNAQTHEGFTAYNMVHQ